MGNEHEKGKNFKILMYRTVGEGTNLVRVQSGHKFYHLPYQARDETGISSCLTPPMSYTKYGRCLSVALIKW